MPISRDIAAADHGSGGSSNKGLERCGANAGNTLKGGESVVCHTGSKGDKFRPRIALTMGDPCGIGPEIIVKAFAASDVLSDCVPVVVGDPLALKRAIDLTGANLHVEIARDLTGVEERHRPGLIHVICPLELSGDDMPYGGPSSRCSRAVILYIETAARLALEGKVQAVCTCPVNKANLHRCGFPFPGHTEFFCKLTAADEVVMMLAGPRLRVSLVTIHHALSSVAHLLTRERLFSTIRITGETLLKDFRIRSPRIAVAGLNPHAGEEGRFGREEIELIRPVILDFEKSAFKVSGPFAPDTIFHRAYNGEFDAVVAMYHDQGLIPIKLVHFREAVNISLGLPIIRTSVDHGTAYEIAGTATADSGSLTAAIRLAAVMARNRTAEPALHT